MGVTPRYDGRLPHWAEVQGAAEWDALVLGNGLSINIWGNFAYDSLYEEAKAQRLFSAEDALLFEKLGASTFEQVLHPLAESIRVGKALGKERTEDLVHYQSVQKALGRAVHSVHIERSELPGKTLDRIRKEIRFFRHVFTTSYDLLLYWAVVYADPSLEFVDFFWACGAHGQNAFDESTHTFSDSDSHTRLYFLHGALHLVVHGSGITCKRKSRPRTLLDQFGMPHGGEATARPLIVTEARAEEKKRSIVDNRYLSYCWRSLRKCDVPLVIFGHSLNPQDNHLVEVLNEASGKPIAVSLRDNGQRMNAKEQHRIASLIDRPLHFFDSRTHPLGADDLSLEETPWRRLWRSLKQAA